MNDSLWSLQEVTLAGRTRPRLDGVSVQIPPGVTAVVGQSGAGKTSLLNLLVGFERPDRGTVTKNGSASPDRIPLFWVPQSNGLWPHLTVAEHLQAMMPIQSHHGHSGRADRREPAGWTGGLTPPRSPMCVAQGDVASLLERFDLGDKSEGRPDQLSQGECARLSVARALASRAAVLVMDEPLVHVDPARIHNFWDVIAEHCQESGTALVFATHSPETVLRQAEWAVCLDEGRVVYVGRVDDLYYRPPSERLAEFLGPVNWLTPDEALRWLEDTGGPRSQAPLGKAVPGSSASRDAKQTFANIGSQTEFGNQRPYVCYRPEQITIRKADQSPFVVRSSRFAGSVAEVDLQDEGSGQTRRFFHRPAGNLLQVGDRVLLQVALAMLGCLLLTGCLGEASSSPPLDVKTVHTWSMPPEGPSIPAPRALTVGPDEDVYCLDDAGRVLVFNSSGELLRQWEMPESDVGNPEGICILRDGRVVVADTHYHRVVFFDRAGELLAMHGELGKEPGQFIYPVALTEDDAGNYYVCEYGENDRVQKFSPDGEFLLEFGSFGTEPGQFQRPSGIVWVSSPFSGGASPRAPAVNSALNGTPGSNSGRSGSARGTLYVVDAFNNRIQVFSETGEFLGILGEEKWGNAERKKPMSELPTQHAALHYPYDIARSPEGDLYVVEYGAGRVSRFDRTGHLLGQYGHTGGGEQGFSTPWGLTVASGPRILVADTGNRRIVELQL